MTFRNLLLQIYLITSSTLGFCNEPKSNTGLMCALDMGSNSFKFAIAEFKNGKYIQHDELKETVAVGDDIQESFIKTGKYQISESKLNDIKELFIKFKKRCYTKTRSFLIYAVGTAAYRDATNSFEIEKLAREYDIKFEIASEERESRLAYESTTFGDRNFAVVDFGSRSIKFSTMTSGFGWRTFKLGYRTAYQDNFMTAPTFESALISFEKKLKLLISESDLKLS